MYQDGLRPRFGYLLSIMLFFLFFSRVVSAEDGHSRFNVDAVMQADGTMQVTEHIHVIKEGGNIEHGIYRLLPLIRHYADPLHDSDELRQRLDIRFLDASLDGRPVEMYAENDARHLNWRFGIKGRSLPEGPHDYVIRYSVGNSFMRNGDTDTLWWNITGDNWTLNFDEVTFALHLPDEAGSVNRLGRDSRFSHISYFVGKPDSQNNASGYHQDIVVNDDGHILSHRDTLGREGVTASYSWPAGLLLSAPSPATEGWLARIGYNFWRSFIPDQDALLVWLPVGLLAGWLLLYLLTHPPFFGRFPVSSELQDALPAEVTPGLAACALNHRYSASAFTADLLQLVARGAVYWEHRIGPVESNVLHILPENKVPMASLPHPLQALLKSLQQQPDLSVDLTTRRHPVIQRAFLQMGLYYKKLARKCVFYGPSWPSLMATVAALASFIIGDGVAATVKVFFPFSVVVLVIGVFSLLCQPRFLKKTVAEARQSEIKHAVRNILIRKLACYTPLNIFPVFLVGFYVAEHMQPGTFGACFATIYLNMIYQALLPEYSRLGKKSVAGISSLLLYIQQQAQHQVTKENQPETVVTQCQRLLPYALALRPDEPMTKSLIQRAGGFALSAGGDGALSWSQICSLQSMVQAASCFTADRTGSSNSDNSGYDSSGCGGDSGGGDSGGGDSGGGSW